ncbi:OmcA/MtrC family decaheme c-type cytochrome [Ketobacter sp.]|uniref:OmcA/MtrC family decaheme c-type cytochrome n=1 Tax=Ketobacter sp. TaxID=2083498 RepID=UPI0025B7CF0C|nr:OmcA/MtrC family decaheme c-type cytochrome [Ketobacter sp.]
MKGNIMTLPAPRWLNCLSGRFLTLTLALILAACGGGGGSSGSSSSRAPDNSGLTLPNTGSPVLYAQSPTLLPIISRARLGNGGVLVVDFQLTDEDYNAILDLTAADFRLSVAKLQGNPIGNLTGHWQSYINRIEQPGVGPGLEARLQATAERATSGSFTNNGDGTYRYVTAASLTQPPADVQAQAARQGLSLVFEAARTHRVALQFDNGRVPANPYFDWVPATGKSTDILHYRVVATENCNSCHSSLAFHGGGRTEVEYCVTCHNPGSSDANSGHSVDFKVMIHKIHRGADLPSVQAGGSYTLYGFGDTPHDYSAVRFPRDIRDCHLCHAGSATGAAGQTLTHQGDNWNEYAGQDTCGACHDDLDFSQHYGGQDNDDNCMSCHSVSGVAGSIASVHVDPVQQARAAFEGRILAVENTGQGEFPTVRFAVVNPLQGDAPYHIQTDPPFTQSGASLSLKLAWSTTDYTNTGSGSGVASTLSVNGLSSAVANGDGSFSVTFGSAIPDGSLAPNVAASGSGSVVLEGRMAVDIGSAGSPDIQRVPLTNVVKAFAITDSSPAARRQVVALDNCLACHGSLSLHGDNRTDSIDSCVTCHNPRNTDRVRRTAPPYSDGKTEESIDFKTMIHAIHGAGFRARPLVVVGFGGTEHVYDESSVHFPGELNNCNACHVNNSYELPLHASVLATSVDSGADLADRSDDTLVSPQAAVCASCHDDAVAQSHMESNGADFATSEADLGSVLEQCELCHGDGRTYSVKSVHGL